MVVFRKTRDFAHKLFPYKVVLTADDTKVARDYIAAYWSRLERFHPKDDESQLGLPKPYLVPAFEEGHEFDFNELYYWDSYFMVQGLLDKNHKELTLGILENLVHMFERFKIIPNASRTYLMGRSQPPFLTSLIFDLYDTYKMDKRWLKRVISVAEAEYNMVWMGTTKPNARQVYQGLSRYYDINYLNDLAEAESGWDMNPRFGRQALHFLPVDLNTLLYKYEMDFSRAAEIFGDESKVLEWQEKAATRKSVMDKLMWNDLKGMYFDFDYTKEKRGTVNSLAAYYALWTGMADEQQAARLVKSLKRFEVRGGVATTDAPILSKFVPGNLPMQWAYPNGWAPLHFIVVEGLERYGYHQEARRIALKWLKTNLDWFNAHGVFLEKYNVASPGNPPARGVYPSLTGFGWTNAVFEHFCQKYIDK
ncbi:alpha,alpha-trehalase [Candidatus Saccharibacteria bacterium]|nr:alpha,alpha-trehalase [Candidatus Saccharibacteria bacterium]MBI3338256.1 alpha,alpha-trehalase [Candidatus Saccharibacteria bacterium]